MTTKKSSMDIVEPGTTPAAATSRPLIITKGAMMKDPMVDVTDKTAVASQSPVVQPVGKKKIEPLTTEQKTAEIVPEKTTVAEEPIAIDTTDDLIDESTDTSSVDPTDPISDDKELAELEKRQAAVNVLVKQKKYFVPIGAVAKRKASRVMATTLVLLIFAGIGVILAIDAELIAVDVTLPFDFIKK